MKKGFTFAVILLLLNINVRAQQISPDEAKETALQFMQSHDEASRALPRGAETVSLSYTAQTGQNNDFYVFNYPNDGGFVIVSADTRTLNPVLAYSTQGSFNADYIPENEAYLLSTYQQQIESLRQNEIVNTIVYGNSQEPNVIVEPLIKTQWKQSEPYNGMCPIDSVSRKQCLVGCIATAMAQVMNYWKWPEKGHGLHYNYNDTSLCVNFDESVYDWDNTLSIYDSESDIAKVKETQKIMYHCGVAANAIYGTEFTSANDLNLLTAITNYFDYKPTAHSISYDDLFYSYYNPDEVWINTIRQELDEGRPVFFGGTDLAVGGHMFICDGYDDCNYLHFNFGWGGQNDGFYLATVVRTKDRKYCFNYDLRIIIDVEPDRDEGYNDGYAICSPHDYYPEYAILDRMILPYDTAQTLIIPDVVSVNGENLLVAVISSYAFESNYGIKDIIFPSELFQISPYAFTKCNRLEKAEVPSSIWFFEKGVFAGCNNLKSLTVNRRNPFYYSPANSNAVIETDSKRLIQGCNYTVIPEDVQIIGMNAFELFDKIESVNLPLSVYSIEKEAYRSCVNLKYVSLHNNMESIDDNAFEGCTSLTDVYCFADNPPQITETSFPSNVTVHVSKESISKYYADPIWSQLNIVDDLSDNVEQHLFYLDENANLDHYYDIMGRQTDLPLNLRITKGKKYYYY